MRGMSLVMSLVTVSLTISAQAEIQIPTGLYPTMGQITRIEDEEVCKDIFVQKVFVEDAAGREYAYYDDAEDLFIGDLMALMMFDNATPEYVLDDCVVDARYVGVPEFFEPTR